jgi:microcystin degradation protein MlrC
MRTIDFISGYQTYPHLDMYETGYRAARRMIECLQGKRTKTARVAIPQIAPAHAYTTGEGALGTLMKKAQNLKDSGKIIDYNIFQVQPWLDIKDIASTVVICAETEERAKDIATELAKDELALRKELQGEALPSVAEIVQKALSNDTGKPIVLGDSADSPNAGACGDCAEILEYVLPYQETLSTAVGLMDPVAVEKAFEVGEGNTATFSLGATIAPKLSKPVTLTATVQGLYDGDFYRVGPQEKGVKVSLGKTAVLQAGKVRIHLVCKGLIGDLGFYRAFGTEPSDCQLVCVKACTSFRAGYAPISHAIYNANTHGAAGCSLKELPYKNLPKPFYPFEEIGEEDISHAKIYR